MKQILLIDDDIELCEMLKEYFGSENFILNAVHTGDGGVKNALSGEYDVIVLDVMLPGLNGFEVLQEIRKESTTPILMLTARGNEVDRIVGLEMGADDYLPKPFNPRELVARLRAILRRSDEAINKNGDEIIQVGILKIDSATRRATQSGEVLTLTSMEYNLLETLMRHAGQVIDKETLSMQAFGRKLERYDRSIDMHISKLRRQLSPGKEGDSLIKTVRGVGYQLTRE